MADKAIEFIKDAHVNAPDKPFYLHYCTGAGHAPHHVPKEWADRYAGKFDGGWDEYRKVVHQKQLDMGVLAPGTAFSDPDPDFPRWDTLDADHWRLYDQMMEVYAGFVSFTDHHFGRVLDFLKEIDELDNTLIMVVSDNGASAEGGPTVFNHYPWGWTSAGNTPFRRWKRETYRGGTTDPCIVSWPKKVTAANEMRPQYAHTIDMVPTILDALDIQPPTTIRGVRQEPIEGVSFAYTFDAGDAASKHHTQYFEMYGHRSIYHEGWRAVCPWPGANFTEAAKKWREFSSPITPEVLADIEANDWELYDLTTDAAETHDIVADHRDRLIEMVGRWCRLPLRQSSTTARTASPPMRRSPRAARRMC